MKMQEARLFDTMPDNIVDRLGAFPGASVGLAYANRYGAGGRAGVIAEFVKLTPSRFKRLKQGEK